jgi:hypothetical protein
MMNHQLLGETIGVLKNIRMEIHDIAENGVINQLDKIIQDLEADYAKDFSHKIEAKDILVLLGWLIEHLPKFAEIVERLIKRFTE